MRIISFAQLKAFFTKHADAKTAMEDWNQQTKKAQWKDFADVKKTFNSVDAVGNNRYVFNVKGNNYRIVALILFKIKRLYIRWVGTHAEYDKLKDIDKL
jgi:mRNA interferase HigB